MQPGIFSKPPQIIDVRNAVHQGSTEGADLRAQIIEGLSKPPGQKTLPSLLLYDERGLRLFDAVTTDCPDYYVFTAEYEILRTKADEIVRTMLYSHLDSIHAETPVVLELGAGALRKTSHILSAIARLPGLCSSDVNSAEAPVTYIALDLEKNELVRTLNALQHDHGMELEGKVETKGLCGTYDEGLKFLAEGGLAHAVASPLRTKTRGQNGLKTSPPLHIMFFGASLGNFDRLDSVNFLRSLPLRPGSSDTLLVGIDHVHPREKIERAYNDPEGVNREFILNSLRAAGRALGDEKLFAQGKWQFVNMYKEDIRRHEEFVMPETDQVIHVPGTQTSISLCANELINIDFSVKNTDADAFSLFTASELRPIRRWTNTLNEYSVWLLERPAFTFPLLTQPFVEPSVKMTNTPSLQEWDAAWKAWDTVTGCMLAKCPAYNVTPYLHLFGHSSTFLDYRLSQALDKQFIAPEHLRDVFQHCYHEQSSDSGIHRFETPKKSTLLPTKDELLQLDRQVRARLTDVYDDISSGKRRRSGEIDEVLSAMFAHQGDRLESLLAIASLEERALNPLGFSPPGWESLAKQWNAAPRPHKGTVILGPMTPVTTDQETNDKGRTLEVGKFEISWRPATNEEFLAFLEEKSQGKVHMPESWIEADDAIKVKTLYGPVEFSIARHWPVCASYEDLSEFAKAKGGRLPSENELCLFYEKYSCGYEGGANIGFRNWHCTPASTGVSKDGKGHNGGVWEWTSSVFHNHQNGFDASDCQAHERVVVGGSFVTAPRLAIDRRSQRRFNPRSSSWISGRVAYDIS